MSNSDPRSAAPKDRRSEERVPPPLPRITFFPSGTKKVISDRWGDLIGPLNGTDSTFRKARHALLLQFTTAQLLDRRMISPLWDNEITQLFSQTPNVMLFYDYHDAAIYQQWINRFGLQSSPFTIRDVAGEQAVFLCVDLAQSIDQSPLNCTNAARTFVVHYDPPNSLPSQSGRLLRKMLTRMTALEEVVIYGYGNSGCDNMLTELISGTAFYCLHLIEPAANVLAVLQMYEYLQNLDTTIPIDQRAAIMDDRKVVISRPTSPRALEAEQVSLRRDTLKERGGGLCYVLYYSQPDAE